MPIFFQVMKPTYPIAIESIGNHWPQESIRRKDGYPHYHWLQTEKGSGYIHIHNETILLQEGQGILMKPFIPHSYHSNKDWITTFVTFNGSLSDHFEQILGKETYILSEDHEQFSFRNWIDDAIKMHLSETKEQQQLSIACYTFLLQLANTCHTDAAFSSLDPLYQTYVSPVLEKLETQFDQPLSLDDLASELYFTPQYLCRVFKKYTKETIFSYLLTIRINKAKELLINHTELRIQDIIALCGFSDTSYFIAQFKKATGYTPLQFRKLYIVHKQ